MNTTFTINEIESPVVKDDKGNTLSVMQMIPGYGGWGCNAPTKFVTINGRKAEFVDPISRNTLRFLRMKWADQQEYTPTDTDCSAFWAAQDAHFEAVAAANESAIVDRFEAAYDAHIEEMACGDY